VDDASGRPSISGKFYQALEWHNARVTKTRASGAEKNTWEWHLFKEPLSMDDFTKQQGEKWFCQEQMKRASWTPGVPNCVRHW
jgi:Tfp pilus assembly major pilin PilA